MTDSTRRKPLRTCKPYDTTNAGLWLHKFICNQGDDANCWDKDERRPLEKRLPKSRLVAEVAALPTPPHYARFYDRWRSGLMAVGATCFRAKVQGRMIVGLGDESVLETSVSLHHTYGVPYIPGSALKGLAAAYVRNRLATQDWGAETPAYQVLFGKQEDAGYVTFYDALLKPGSGRGPQGSALHEDVLTPHHPDYYQGDDAPPADWDSPIPVPFLSATGTYLIALGAPEGCAQWLDRAFAILKLALSAEGIGVGAKTSSGYGRLVLHNSDELS